jgi:hypothetical protein
MLRLLAKRLLIEFGYEEKINRNRNRKEVSEITTYSAILNALMCDREVIHVVQVGANDGSINDPI